MLDFTPTKETISLHGLGFIQIVLPGNQRMHVWHPDLPRRECYEKSAVHNHRFGFRSRVLKGTLINRRVNVEIVKTGTGTHDLISHRGPRSAKGGRESEPIADCLLHYHQAFPYSPGDEYEMTALEYHETPNNGIVVTVMKKLYEGEIHANSVCEKGTKFHQDFDRFQLTPAQLFEYVVEALAK